MNSGDTAWMLISSGLVFLMTPAVAFFYGGMVRAKAVLHMMMLSVGAIAVVALAWAACGWSIAYAGKSVGGVFGNPFTGAFFHDVIAVKDGVYTSSADTGTGAYPVTVDAFFQMTFAIITVALISGALAERVKFSTWLVFTLLWVIFDYAPMAHMVWNKGLLSADGAISKFFGVPARDFAGGTVVHINAAIAALVVAMIVGRRKGFGAAAFKPHNVPLFCWVLSCCGSDGSDLTAVPLLLRTALLLMRLLPPLCVRELQRSDGCLWKRSARSTPLLWALLQVW